MPKRRRGVKTKKKKDQDGSGGKDEQGDKQASQGAEQKPETGEQKQSDVDGKGEVTGDEDDEWKWSDGELDDERLQAFFDERLIT